MGKSPKLIILNGFSGNGKSTLAKLYIENHPLALNIEGDEIMGMMGQWKTHYDEARKSIFPLTLVMAKTQLELGHDVIIPYLLVNEDEAQEFEEMAEDVGAGFFEILLNVEREEAIVRLMKRGTWGEEGLPPLTEKDLPNIENLFDRMEKATALRPKTIKIEVKYSEIEKTYQLLIKQLD